MAKSLLMKVSMLVKINRNSDEDDDGVIPHREQDYRSDTTVTKMQKLFEKEDYLFTSTYETLTDQMKKAIEGDRLERFVKELAEKPYIHNARSLRKNTASCSCGKIEH